MNLMLLEEWSTSPSRADGTYLLLLLLIVSNGVRARALCLFTYLRNMVNLCEGGPWPARLVF